MEMDKNRRLFSGKFVIFALTLCSPTMIYDHGVKKNDVYTLNI